MVAIVIIVKQDHMVEETVTGEGGEVKDIVTVMIGETGMVEATVAGMTDTVVGEEEVDDMRDVMMEVNTEDEEEAVDAEEVLPELTMKTTRYSLNFLFVIFQLCNTFLMHFIIKFY